MKKQTISLSIPQPCDQRWDDMRISEKGRHCKQCVKEIIDFSTFSDRQLFSYMSAAKDDVCGQFSPQQLNRALAPPALPRYSGLSVAGLVALAITMTASPVYSQVNESDSAAVELSVIPAEARLSLPYTIRGKVIDAENGRPVFLAVVHLTYRGFPVGTAFTDADGHFSISPAAGQSYDSLTVTASSGERQSSRLGLPTITDGPITIALYRNPEHTPPLIMGMVSLRQSRRRPLTNQKLGFHPKENNRNSSR